MNPYIDPATGTHYNKLGIRNRDDLQHVEYAVTNMRIAELLLKPIPGRFDLEHLKAIHRHIFQDIYEWAGKERTVNFSKRDADDPKWKSPFAPTAKIHDIAHSITDDLRSWNYLRGLGQSEFVAGITTVYLKANYMHPFPEGNGRSTQTLLTQLAREAGYDLDFSKVDKDQWNHAAARSIPQRNVDDPHQWRRPNPELMHEVFKRIVEPIRERTPPRDLER